MQSRHLSILWSPECCGGAAPDRPWRLILLGAPGVGKGTQAELLKNRLGIFHLSTGDMFRAAKSLPESDRSPAMNEALQYMQRGELVPDGTVLAMMRDRKDALRCPAGFLLDGFPRTLAQAESLTAMLAEEGIELDAVVSYDMPIPEIVARLGGRRTCSKCKAVYHTVNLPPKVEGVCDQCGGELFQREDDRPESVEVRMQAYARSTAPLVEYYQGKGLLVSVDAAGGPEEVYQRTLDALKQKS